MKTLKFHIPKKNYTGTICGLKLQSDGGFRK